MKKNFLLTLVLLLVALFTVQPTVAQAPVATPEQAITGLLNRIGGSGAANKFEIVIDANLAEGGKDVFVITAQNGKPCIKGNNQLSVATGINWYLNHVAHINLTWNNLTTDLVSIDLPVPVGEDKHVSSAKYRYDFNTCTFSYSMAFWTWERWQKEIDWMALHGINAPLNLVGLDVVTRKFLRELGVSENDINAYIAGPGFIAWFAMNNLEGWGGTIESQGTGVFMQGNPDWWYTRQEQLCRNMLQRMRELGMQPVIPGFSGQVPNCIVNYSINGFSSGDVVNNGTWAGGYTRPDILKPNTTSYQTFAAVYYKHLHEVMGVSELYSIDPFHEGSLPGGVTNETCYPNIMVELDNHFGNVEQSVKDTYKVTKSPSWIIQYWLGVPQSGAFTAMKNAGYASRFIGLDLFADNIYADNAAKWRTNYYDTCPYIYCMLHNFGGRSGLHGRLETTMDGYFQALAKNNNCQGIGATPEGTETNPILYDMLFELPWMSSNPGADAWLAEYAHSRYGVDSKTAPAALEALKNLKKSVWDCRVNQQGTSEAVILARPNWTIGSVSSWSTSAIYWDTQDVLLAADQLYSVKDLVTANGGEDGIANYNYDFIDVVRQAMVDYAAQLLPLIKTAHESGDNAEYTRLYQLYLQLMLDLDEMLSYDENFKLERWTSLARNIAGEVSGTTENDRNWLEWNARTQVTVWSKGNTDLHDYSNRCWAGLIKDFHYWRWKYFFENNGNAPSGGWFSGFEYPWTVDFNDVYSYAGDYSNIVIPTDMTATEKAAQTFGNYFGRVKGATKNYIFPMGVATNATKSDVIPEVYRGKEVELPLIIGKEVTISSVWVDLNNDGNAGNGETLTANGNNVTIPADAAIGKTTAKVTYSDGTVITFNLALIEDITNARTVTAVAGANGSVAIEGTNELTITNQEAVKITATANAGYNFENWTKNGEVVSNDNPFIYYGKDAATFTANFIQDKWGVVECGDDVDGLGNVKDEAAVMNDISNNKQYIPELTLAYYNREAETIFEAISAPTSIFTTIPQIINVPQGASFDVEYKGVDNFKHCYFRAYIDLNADGDFDDEGELLKEVGTKGVQNTAVCSNKVNVLLPYNMPLGITHMRLRFDSAWNIGEGAKDPSVRPVYEIIINVTEKSDKAATINVETNSADWGTVEVWTDETPDGSTGTEWVVSANIPMYLRATKASEDTEFLGWYDHYGRLVTENLEHTMYAREDATYTAKFRRFLEIDGWQIEYRTEPGSMVTNKLASGVKPENGKTYYIYAPTRPTNDGDYVNRYLYNNSGTLSLNTAAGDDSYLWTCSVDGENYTFQNVGDPTKYLAHKATAASPYNFTLGTGTTCYEGITIYSVADSRFFVINDDGSGFNQSQTTHNQSTDDHTTDFVFVEVSYPDNVILTKVRQSGNHDLVIPETVEILGEQCTIIGFDNGLFANNKDLWTITLPATIESVSSNVVFCTSFNGTITPEPSNTTKMNSSDSQIIDLGGYALENNKVWTLDVEFESDGSLYNKWGNVLLAGGEDATTNQWLYLTSADNGGAVHLRVLFGSLYVDNGTNYFKGLTSGKTSTFKVSIANQGNGTAIVTVTNTEGTSSSSSAVSFSPGGVTKLSTLMPTGVNITSLEIKEGPVPDPFEGCTNLIDIKVTTGCDYYVTDRKFYSPDGTMLHALASEKDAEKIRALGELIDLTETLIEEVAVSVNPTGKATEIALNATQGNDYYIWCNAPQSGDEGNVGNLLDGQGNTFFHSNWESTTAPADGLDHHLTIELGEGNAISDFSFHYQARSGDGLGDYPKTIKVQGSNNGTDYTDIATVEPRNSNGGTIENGAEWTSGVIGDGNKYTYLRFMVTATTTNKNKDGHIYWHMAEFDLYDLTATAEVAPKYKNLAGVTNEETAIVYDSMAEALYFYNNGGTAAELQAAYDELKPLYTALNAKKNKILNGVYNINYNGAPLFIAYAAANELDGLTGANYAGFRLFDATTTNTDSKHLTIQNNAIAAKVAADALFIIVPKDDYSGYHLSAQGNYMRATGVHNQWNIQAFDTDVANAGVYLFEETATADVFKLKSTINITTTNATTNYVNDWGPVFGSDNYNKENLSTFTLAKVTEYTVAVPENGTTLCLPFNVVLPAGVTAYDIATDNITTKGGYKIYSLNSVAVENETLLKGTPVILKATVAGNYTFTITMDSENAKGATDGSVLRSGMVKTTIGTAELNYTFANNVFNKVTADTEIAANQCWMVLDEDAGAQILDEAPEVGPFVFTTDESNPVLYKIQINRDFDAPNASVLEYNANTGGVNVRADAADNSWQAWYFMAGNDGAVLIKPYNGDGKVLGADDNEDGHSKVWAVENGTKTVCEWTIENNGDWYNILGNGNYFSNHSGVTYKTMGFYNDKNDNGSQFKFVEAVFTDDNPRYYQLKDVTMVMDVTKQAMSGDAPGCRENGDEHYNSYTAAMEQINKGSDVAAAADCYTVYTTLRATREALGDMIMPTPGNVYRLKNHISKSAEEGHKNHYIANSNAKLSFPTEADDNTTLWICVEGADGKFQFISGVGSATLTWKNFGENAVDYEIRSGVEQGAVALAYGTDNLTLTNEENANGVLFGHIANNATEQDNTWSTDWYIEPVADDVKAFHSRSIAKGYNYATLYLPYAATVPDGISAYTARLVMWQRKPQGVMLTFRRLRMALSLQELLLCFTVRAKHLHFRSTSSVIQPTRVLLPLIISSMDV
ncbi:MAG: alpha-N-acetylglucosaminidase C-terminal domain-containing protein [Bacteroidaceae bacterium]|nr:alpha-N-acetylglucosaminidase C-terminal domain-containing protein [Bacteroidaceae bacterium]